MTCEECGKEIKFGVDGVCTSCGKQLCYECFVEKHKGLTGAYLCTTLRSLEGEK